MKKIFVYMASAALMFAVSCNKEEVNEDTTAPVETELITVDLNPMTKTALGAEGTTTWDADDKVSVTVGGKVVGTLSLVEGSTFSGEITAGLSGAAVLNYPAGVTTVPATQIAVAGSFADEAALLEGTTTVEDLRAGTGVELQNKTALLKFTVAQAGDVTFEVGATEYTVTGCKTGSTYYACLAPVEDATFVARIGGYLSKQAPKNVTFTANKIANLNELPAPVASDYALIGSHSDWKFTSLITLYKEGNSYVAYNISGLDEFKIINKSATGWDATLTTNRGGGETVKASGITYQKLFHNGSNIKVSSTSAKYNLTVSSDLSEITIEELNINAKPSNYSIIGSNNNWDSDIVLMTTSTENILVAKNIDFKKDVGVKIREGRDWTNNWSCDWKALKVSSTMDCRKGYDCNMLFADGSSNWDKSYDVYVKLANGAPSKFHIVTAGSTAPTF